MTNARRKLLRRAREWRTETLAFVHLRPLGQMPRAYDRYLNRLRRRDHALWEAVYEVIDQDLERRGRLSYDAWKKRVERRCREMEKIRQRGRQAYLRKWWSANP